MNPKAPIYRYCIACKNRYEKKDLFRLVKISKDIVIDLNQSIGGRGVYIHKSKKCIDQAKRLKLLNKAFKSSEIDEQVYLDLYSKLD